MSSNSLPQQNIFVFSIQKPSSKLLDNWFNNNQTTIIPQPIQPTQPTQPPQPIQPIKELQKNLTNHMIRPM